MSEWIEEFEKRLMHMEKPARLCLTTLKDRVVEIQLTLSRLSDDAILVENDLSRINERLNDLEEKVGSEKIQQRLDQLQEREENLIKAIKKGQKLYDEVSAYIKNISLTEQIATMKNLVAKWDRIRHQMHEEYKKMRKAMKSYQKYR